MDTEAKRRAACCELVADVARSSGEVQLKLTGTSMLPNLWPGDAVTVHHRRMEELQPGQIALCCGDGKLTAHRVVRASREHLTMRGDSLPNYDPPVKASEVVGQVVRVVREGRSIRMEQSIWQRAVSSILRRSDFFGRLILIAGSFPRRSNPAPAALSSGGRGDVETGY